MANPNGSYHLPFDLFVDILSRLPPKPLIRLITVCKSFQSLITSRHFVVSLHLRRSLATNSNRRLVFLSSQSNTLYSVDLDAVEVADGDDDGWRDLTRCIGVDSFHLENLGWRVEMLGSCNGIVCVSDYRSCVVLVNPCTRSLARVDVSIDPIHVALGFGYDADADEYKLVMVKNNWWGPPREVNILGLKSGLWQQVIGDFPFIIVHSDQEGKFVNNALHWLVWDKRKQESSRKMYLISIDIRDGKFEELSLPHFENQRFSPTLHVLSGRLHVKADYYDSQFFDLWVMYEHGSDTPWSKLFTFTYERVLDKGMDEPLAYSQDGCNILFVDWRQSRWYNLENHSIKGSVLSAVGPNPHWMRSPSNPNSLFKPSDANPFWLPSDDFGYGSTDFSIGSLLSPNGGDGR